MATDSLLVRRSLSFREQSIAPTDPLEFDMYKDADGVVRIYRHGEWKELLLQGTFSQLADGSYTTLPTTDTQLVDGQTVITGTTATFPNLTSGAESVYTATVDGSGNITWEAVPIFNEGTTPATGETVTVQSGDTSSLTTLMWDGTEWIDVGEQGAIGAAEDDDYTDGLFTDFVPSTRIGVAVDRFNEILKELSPKPAPFLSAVNMTQSGTAGRLSFGTSNTISGYTNVGTATGNAALDINILYPNAGTRRGIFTPITATGTLASNTSADPDGSYPSNALGDGDKGTLELWANGVKLHETDLATFGSGNSYNINGSGFTLIAATPVEFPNGNPLDLFKYRTGSWRLTATDAVNGWNYIRVNHKFNGVDHWTNYMEYILDAETAAITETTPALGSLSMTGSKLLSGVNYHTGGTASFSATLNNVYRNTYSDGNAITFTATNGSIPSHAIPAMVTEADTALANGTFTVSASRLLNGLISARVNCSQISGPNFSGVVQSISGLLTDTVNTASTDVLENFNVETIRLQSETNAAVNGYASQADVANGSWNSAESLVVGGNSGYNDGLLYENSSVKYPTQGTNGGDYGNIANGPIGNPDYSTQSNSRFVYIRFRNNSGSSRSNFRFRLNGASTTFVANTGSLTGNNMKVSMKFPTGSISSGTGWMDAYNDFATGQWADNNGCRNATDGAGRAVNVDWGMTVGTKSIANNEYIVLRLQVGSTWTGSLTSIQLTWL